MKNTMFFFVALIFSTLVMAESKEEKFNFNFELPDKGIVSMLVSTKDIGATDQVIKKLGDALSEEVESCQSMPYGSNPTNRLSNNIFEILEGIAKGKIKNVTINDCDDIGDINETYFFGKKNIEPTVSESTRKRACGELKKLKDCIASHNDKVFRDQRGEYQVNDKELGSGQDSAQGDGR